MSEYAVLMVAMISVIHYALVYARHNSEMNILRGRIKNLEETYFRIITMDSEDD